MPLHDVPCVWPQAACICPSDCGTDGGHTIMQGNGPDEEHIDPHGECRAEIAALRQDAMRWRALLNSERIRPQGWNGFDRDGNLEPSMDPRGYMHFGMDFWSHHSTMEVALGRTILTNYADALIAQRAKREPH